MFLPLYSVGLERREDPAETHPEKKVEHEILTNLIDTSMACLILLVKGINTLPHIYQPFL